MLIALAGNQNSGKTTLFNQLTGSNQHVGNFPGVTVERKEGAIKKQKDAVLVDLPGIYSLSPYSAEEVVTRDFLVKSRPDAIIDIVDATNIERNLYLTLQLMELGIPMVIALNMMDEVRKSGNSIDVLALEKALGVPVVPISASRNEGTQELLEHVMRAAREKTAPKKLDFCRGAVHKAIHSIAHIVEDKAAKAGYSPRFTAAKLIEGDKLLEKELGLNKNELDIVGHVASEMEQSLGTDRKRLMADMRNAFLGNLRGTVTKHNERGITAYGENRRDFNSPVFALPIFLSIKLLIFATFELSGRSCRICWARYRRVTGAVSAALIAAHVAAWYALADSRRNFCGSGGVVFLPTSCCCFSSCRCWRIPLIWRAWRSPWISFKEDRGFPAAPRAHAHGFRSSVPAIMATRTLASDRDRKMTINTRRLCLCSANLPFSLS
jgi:ferrous iron transport protein B